MSFTRARPGGWTDDITIISAAEINQIDINQSRGLDGTSGGAYTPSDPIIIDGDGIESNNVVIDGAASITAAATVSLLGILSTSGASARIRYARVNSTTLGDADGSITLSSDLWVLNVPLLAERTYTLPAPASSAVGDRITFRRSAAAIGAFAALIARSSGTVIAATAAASNVNTIEVSFHTEGAVTDWFPISASGTGAGMNL